MLGTYFTLCVLACAAYSKEEVYFTKFPKDVTSIQGTSVMLPCEVSSNRGFYYSWELNGSKIKNTTRQFQKGGNLYITRVDRERDSGQFRCVAEDITGRSAAVISSPASINIQWIGEATVKLQEPPSVSLIRSGEDVILKCHCDSSDEINVEWFQNLHRITKSSRHILKKNKLHIRSVQSSDNGVYRCVAKNVAGTQESAQNFPLVIQGDNTIPIKIVPSDVIVREQSRSIFHCLYHQDVIIQWYFAENVLLQTNNRIRVNPNGSLEINKVTRQDEGFYTCAASRESSGEPQRYSAKLSLAYIEPMTNDSFEPAPSSDFDVAVGLNALFQLSCLQPKGRPMVRYWWEDPKGFTISDIGRIRVDDDRMLVIDNVTKHDAGDYKCVASNIAGTVSRIVTVMVTEKPRITKDPQSVAVDQGATSYLTCDFETDYPAFTKVNWRKDGELIRAVSDDKEEPQRIKIYQHNGTLVIHVTQSYDRGEYNCEVVTSGHDGVPSKPATISVIEQLKFSPPPVNKNIELGSVARVHCKAQGTPPPIVRWQKGGASADPFPNHVVDLNGTLQFNGVMSEDRGVYACIASNSQGTINATINVDIVVAPKFTIEPKNLTEVDEGQAASMDCVVEGDPKPKIYWDKNSEMNNLDRTRFKILSNGTLFISEVRKEDENIYGCTAGNSAGLNRKEVRLVVRSPGDIYLATDDENAVTKAVFITMAVATAYIVLVVGLTVWCRYKRRSRNSNSEALKNEEGNDDHVELKDTNGTSTTKTADETNDMLEPGCHQPSNNYDELAVSRSQLKDVKLIGRGEFGDVLVAKIPKSVVSRSSRNAQNSSSSSSSSVGEDKDVLVKALNQTKDENCLAEFKREIDMFSKLSHENVTRFYGLCKEAEPHYMIVEYTDWGDLKKFLVATQKEKAVALTTVQCITILHQLSRGMDHLAGSRWVHKDLAARNCLVSSKLFAKVSLPRLSRDPYSQEYCKYINQVIPLRWLPHEAVYEDDYSTKTDTYSFGVLIWEVFSKGELPQSKMNDTHFLTKLKENALEWKSHPSTPEQLIKLQESCWSANPAERPLFSAVSSELSSILKSV